MPSPLAPVDEPRVDAQRDVVQEHLVADTADVDAALDAVTKCREGRQRVVGVEPDIAREVVARAPRDADERQVPLDGHLSDGAERAVAAGHAQHLCVRFPGEVG